LGLIEHTRSRGRENVWRLTASGTELERAIWLQTPAAVQRSVALDLLRDRGGRPNHRAVSVLRLIAAEPGLSNLEIARRVGIEQDSRISALLSRLARLGLIEKTKTGGRQNVWQLTASGKELDAAIGRETAALGRSAALDLPGGFRGGLSDDAVSALRVIAAQPGHNNTEIAVRAGIERTGTTSKLLARLAGLGLIENTKTGGVENAWQLTASGTQLQRAIRQETEAPVARSTALDLPKDRGGRLNHRAVSVLRAIAAEPGLSNSDLAERVSIRATSQMSRVLARLVRLALIENAVDAPALFEANAWQLTASGRNLESAIRRESPDAAL
jgi:DNA-binding MarR family transcriptional regulator